MLLYLTLVSVLAGIISCSNKSMFQDPVSLWLHLLSSVLNFTFSSNDPMAQHMAQSLTCSFHFSHLTKKKKKSHKWFINILVSHFRQLPSLLPSRYPPYISWDYFIWSWCSHSFTASRVKFRLYKTSLLLLLCNYMPP